MEKIKNIIKKFPKKIMRRFFGIFAVCGLSLAIFSPNVCYAANNNEDTSLEQQETFSQNLRSVINMISQIVYIFIWPLLVIAGTALDNTLVYGKFLNLDAALWDIWNIMKNVANFALGFVFIFAVVKNLFKTSFGDGNPLQDAVKVVKRTLISGVLVQMSWFILGTLIDLSTILIYAIGGLPLSMLGSYDADAADVPIMELHANLDESDGSFFHYYSYGGYNFSPCFVIDNNDENSDIKLPLHKGKYIAGRDYLYLSGDKTFDTGYCTLDGYPYRYVEPNDFFCGDGVGGIHCYTKSGNTLGEMNPDYKQKLVTYIKNLSGDSLEAQKQNCFIISAYGTGCELSSDTGIHYGAISFKDDIFASAQGKMDSLLESSKGRVGPLITMYSSILKVQELLVNSGNTSTMSSLFGALINTFFVVVLFIPIAILAILLIIRIGFLWVTIAISPILILINLGPDPINKLGKNDIFKKFTMKEVFMRIFSPIVVVFAVSLSIIFLTTINASKPGDDNKQFLDSLGIQQNCDSSAENGGSGNTANPPENCRYLVSGLLDLKINLSGFNHGKDVFVWCLMMLLSVGIVRFFMKFAISMMGDKGKELFKTAEKLITNYPIIPLGKNGDKVGIGAFGIGEGNSGRLSGLMDEKVNSIVNLNEQNNVLNRLFGPDNLNGKGDENENKKQVDAILDEVRAGKKPGNLTEEQQTLVKNYYGGDAAVAQQIVNDIYNYSTNDSDKTAITNAITSGMKKGDHTNADALKLTASQLDMAVKNDSTWISWAAGMIGGAVHTRDGVRIVDTMPGTAEANNPVYTIVTRDIYEKHRFGDQPESLTKKDFDGRKDQDNAKYEKMNKYLEEMDKRYKELQGLQGRNDLSENEQTMLEKLNEMFGSGTLERLKALDDTKFIQEQPQ